MASANDIDALHRSDCTLCHRYTGSKLNTATVRQVIARGVAGTPVSCTACHTDKEVNHHGGASSGSGCVGCHGHDVGTRYDPDSSTPYSAGTIASQGRGTAKSHSTHTELDIDDQRGPQIYCDSCHNIGNFPFFKAGTDLNGDGRFDLAETDVCNSCHSAAGAFDGVNHPVVGAKANWQSGSYKADGSLQSGKEFWCVGCHDGQPANSKADGTGVAAPDKAGDNSSYGYYVTGHGLTTGYNATRHGQNGPGYQCTVCHDSILPHLSHSLGDASRLASVPDDERDYTSKISEVCLDCHAAGQTGNGALGYDAQAEASIHSGAISDKYTTATAAAFPAYGDSANYAANPGYQCDACHEVHGTSKLAMILETIDGQVAGVSNPVTISGFESSDTDLSDLDQGSASEDGVCDACHAVASVAHPDTNHPGNHHQGNAGNSCIHCHAHTSSFAHAGGSGTGSNCGVCHGKDTDKDGKGSTQSHSTHTESDSDDQRDPLLACSVCHDTSNYPYFNSGTDANVDGKINLAETDVCDVCHSPGGSYDGIAAADFGAKMNWDSGIYAAGNSLQAGKEKWCATCHDESPSVISSVSAPNVIGGESAGFTYGTGWGYYQTGHGLSGAGAYPASGGIVVGAGLECDDCHDYTAGHVDGDVRTYSARSSEDYRTGYRLKLVGGNDPMTLPWPQSTPLAPERFALCASCHDPDPFQGLNNNTNLVFGGTNYHAYHIGITNIRFDSDWSGGAESRISCTTCHNVHGSTPLAIVRDGRLIGREPGLQVWYKNDAIVSYNGADANPPDPENLTLVASTGLIWNEASSANVCSTCHTHNWTTGHARSALWWQGAIPVLDWTWEAFYQGRGIHTDRLFNTTETVPFRITYFDPNNDTPTTIELWVDKNDNGSYEDNADPVLDERLVMIGADVGDTTYTDGKIYTVDVQLTNFGDNSLSYRVYASDGSNDAVGQPAQDQTIEWDANLTRDVPGEYASLQDALNAAYDGNTVVVADGSYNENIDFSSKNLIIRSANGAEVTSIIGSGSLDPCVSFTNGETEAILEGFTIENSAPDDAEVRGVLITNGATPTIRDCVITGNTADVNATGGGVKISGGSMTLEDTAVTGNWANSGGGIYAENISEPMSITGCTIDNNTGYHNAGVALVSNSFTTTFTDTSISGNNSGAAGGGISADNAPVELYNCTLNNNVGGNASGEHGGALYLVGTTTSAIIENSTINSNTSAKGAGIYLSGSIEAVPLTVTNCDISNNTGNNGYGGGLRGNGAITIDSAYIQGNTCGDSGAGIYSTGGSLDVINTMITGNRDGTYTWARGGGIKSDSASTRITNSTLTANFATDHGGVSSAGGMVTNSIVWNSFISGGRSYPNISGGMVSFSDTGGGGYTDGGDNINADPQFLAASSAYPSTAGDFRLQSTSPCKDSGTSVGAPDDDITGDSRPYDVGYDMGADEFNPASM